MSSRPRGRLEEQKSAAATEVRELAEPLAPQSAAASAPPEHPHRTIRLRGSVERADVDGVCARASSDLAGCRPGVISCDVAGVEDPALPVVEVLARLALIGRRNRHRMRLEHASPAILDLLRLCGLADVLGENGRESGGEVGG